MSAGAAEFPHLHPSQHEIAQLSNEERIAWIRQERWIQCPRAKRILDRLAELVDYPPHDRMPCLVIYGGTGMGKTRIVQKFLRDHRAHFDRKLGRTRVPVVSIQMPPAPVERGLYEEILVAMGGVFVYGTGVTTLRHRIRALARQLEVRMLIIDEIHSLLAGTFREQRIILNAIRFLANDLRIPLVCLGTEEANQALMTDQQLADRFSAAELPAWENEFGAAPAQFRIYSSIAPVVGFPRPESSPAHYQSHRGCIGTDLRPAGNGRPGSHSLRRRTHLPVTAEGGPCHGVAGVHHGPTWPACFGTMTL